MVQISFLRRFQSVHPPSLRHAALGEVKLVLLRQRPLMDQIMAGALGSGSGSEAGRGARDAPPSQREALLLAAMLSALLRCCDNVMRTRLGKRLKLRCVECGFRLIRSSPWIMPRLEPTLKLVLASPTHTTFLNPFGPPTIIPTFSHWPITLLLLRCAECLGLLGAVDPARVTVQMPLPDALCEFRRDGALTLEVQLVQR